MSSIGLPWKSTRHCLESLSDIQSVPPPFARTRQVLSYGLSFLGANVDIDLPVHCAPVSVGGCVHVIVPYDRADAPTAI